MLAYGYELDDSSQLTLHVYDPNTDPEHGGWRALILNLSNPTHTTPIDSNVNIDEGVRGFFRVPYAFSNPASLEPVTPLASNALFVWQGLPRRPRAGPSSSPLEVIMQNLGGTTWKATGTNPFRLGSQNPQDNATWGLQRVDVPNDVAPGDEVTFTFQATAPTVAGSYNFQWRMVDELVTWFGDFTPNIPVVVQVPVKAMHAKVSPYSPKTGYPSA